MRQHEEGNSFGPWPHKRKDARRRTYFTRLSTHRSSSGDPKVNIRSTLDHALHRTPRWCWRIVLIASLGVAIASTDRPAVAKVGTVQATATSQDQRARPAKGAGGVSSSRRPADPGTSSTERTTLAATAQDVWMDSQLRRFAIAALIVLAWIILGLVRESRPFGLSPQNPWRVRAGFARFDIYSASGVAQGAQKARTEHTNISVVGSGNPYVTSYSHASVYDSFRIIPKEGSPRDFELSNWNVSLLDGDPVSLAWMIRKGQGRGPYFLFVNHTTGNVNFDERVLRPIVGPLKSLLIPFWLVVGTVVIPFGGPISWEASPWLCFFALITFPLLFMFVRWWIEDDRLNALQRSLLKQLVPKLTESALADRVPPARPESLPSGR